MTLWLAGGVAFACPELSSTMQVGAALGDIADAIEDGEQADALRRLDALAPRLPCLDEPIDPGLLAIFARDRAIVAFEAGDTDAARTWGLLARRVDPGLVWGTAHPASHPLRVLVEVAPEPPDAQADGGLRVPRGGAVYVNGEPASLPVAPEGLPTLVQAFGRDQELILGQWQQGADFPIELLIAGGGPVPVAKAPKSSAGGGSSKVAPLVASGALLATSAATYALAGVTAKEMPELRTSQELTAARSRANAFVVASGASFAGAVGIGVGVLVSR